MAEIKRGPIKITVGDGAAAVEYDAFDENHTFNDIIRYMVGQGAGMGEFQAFFDSEGE